MTQAFNLSLLANKVNSSGVLDVTAFPTSGVTAGSYTQTSITVDAYGRITAASNGAGGGVTSLNGQTGAIDNTTQYAIGSYVLGTTTSGVTKYNNTTLAGSSLYATGSNTYYAVGGESNGWSYVGRGTYVYYAVADSNFAVLVNTGSWRCVSIAGGVSSPGYNFYAADSGLWVRYA